MSNLNRLAFLLAWSVCAAAWSAEVEVSWLGGERTWVGPQCWANRLQDWRVANGRLECVEGRHLAMRTTHLLTARVQGGGGLRMRARVGLLGDGDAAVAADAAGGFLVGAGGSRMDPRAAAIVHGWPGPGGGLFAGVRPDGQVFVTDFARELPARRFADPVGVLSRDGWRVSHADSLESESPPAHAIDGDPGTIWHTQWREAKPPHPHEIVIDLGRVETTSGFAYLARQDGVSGRVDRYAVHLSMDGATWGDPAARGNLASVTQLQRVHWSATPARFVKLVAESSHSQRPSTTVAELWLLAADPAGSPPPAAATPSVSEVDLTLIAVPADEGGGLTRLTVRSQDPETGRVLSQAILDVAPGRLTGNAALVSHPGSRAVGAAGRWWFGAWTLSGEAILASPESALGSILSAQYTVSRGVLRLSAQLFPLGEDDDRDLRLETLQEGEWLPVPGEVGVGFVATFRVQPWDATRDVPYRLVHTLEAGAAEPLVSTWEGVIRRDPVGKNEIVLAALSCNHNNSHGIGSARTNWVEGMWFPHADLTSRAAAHEPDLYFFPGDQIYEGRSPTAADRQHLELDYLYKWYLWCWAYRGLTRDTPCVVIPDDHDVFQGNVWGEGGRPAARDHLGGYVHPAEWVKMVQRTQTSHLPDAHDPSPVDQGIDVYYTHLVWGGVSFAVLEDRKWKSGCKRPGMPPSGTGRPDHFNDPEFDTAELDLPELELLGSRQLEFLGDWARDWRGAKLKCVLSQTVFANLATHHGGGLTYLIADLDSNGWPQSGRRRAVAAIRRAFAPHIAGDQHLGTLARHGIDAWDDSSWSFCLPATANFYPRAWWPPRAGADRPEGAPPWMGRHRDGFGNRVTVHAATNPGTLRDDGNWEREPTGRWPADLHDKMPGYGIIRFDKSARTFTFECWPRGADPGQDPQYTGWPRTITQTDNYAREPAAWLPELDIEGPADPLVEVLDSAGDLVYALRPRALAFTPWVFAPGTYTVEVSHPETGQRKVLTDLLATKDRGGAAIRVSLER